MRVKTYCDHFSIHGYWVLRCYSRCPDQDVSVNTMRDKLRDALIKNQRNVVCTVSNSVPNESSRSEADESN
ncbi:hypothetical protein TNCV_933631 [Trichonephila clavipes]|nr:hypothetical protein TNCV_933631 [Trichonephila clavipes]